MKANKENYIVECYGEPVTGLTFERDGKANVHTGILANAIRYTFEESEEVAFSIGHGAASRLVNSSLDD